MLELQGKYASAKVFTDVVDSESISQVINLLNQPYVEGSKVRMMPDIHAGAGCTIGTTMTIKDKICPNLVGVDIGCGMETIRLKETNIEPQKLDKVIREGIPSAHSLIIQHLQNILLNVFRQQIPQQVTPAEGHHIAHGQSRSYNRGQQLPALSRHRITVAPGGGFVREGAHHGGEGFRVAFAE